jgi:ATP-dependent Clp protease protease subunit
MAKPIRIIEGNARPHEPFWTLRNAAEGDSGEPELEFYGYISEYSWYDDDVTPRLFKEDLLKLGNGGPVTIRMNSGGGDVFAASVIRSIIVDYPGRVTVRIDGLCASAATYVAIAGDVVKMQDTAYFMIHDPWTITWGGIEDLKKVVAMLETVKAGIIDGYLSKSNLKGEKLAKMMTAETWMTANEAKTYGFIDEVITSGSKASLLGGSSNAVIANALKNYVNVPAALLADASEPDNNQQAADVLRAEAKKILATKGSLL